MSRAALSRARTASEQPQEASHPATLALEAEFLAELAGKFALFGPRIGPEAEGDAGPAVTADDDVRMPANERVAAARPSLPVLTRRGLHIDPRRATQVYPIIDWLFVLIVAACAARWGAGASLTSLPTGQALSFLAMACALKAGPWLTDVYRQPPSQPARSVGGYAISAVLGIFLANAFAPDARAAAALSLIVPLAAMALAGLHAALALWIGAAQRKGVFAETVVLVGASKAARRMMRRDSGAHDIRVVAVVDDRQARGHRGMRISGTLDDLLAWDGLPYVDRIVIAVSPKAESRVREIIQKLRAIPNRIDLLLDIDVQSVRGRGAERFVDAAVACISAPPHRGARAFAKRFLDLLLGSVALAVLALPMCAIALAIRLGDGGSAFYRERRRGFNNQIFTILKFRTMRAGRVTRIGRFLRNAGLDNLPQLFNVLAGEMSLVGPRPHAVGLKAAGRDLDHIVADYAHRHRVKPGIIGWAQINGAKGPMRGPACLRRRVKLDLEYVAHASLWLDLQILAQAVARLTRAKSAPR